jgi:O-methyltransferase involved in polyketide biosynthesis
VHGITTGASDVTDKVRVEISGAPQTMLATLYGRAADAAAEHPILGDTFAKDLVSRLDYDWSKTGLTTRHASSLTMRSAHFDNWARQFLAAHERAVVLHLGCGLDSRVFRLNPGAGVEWYDVDYPDVIALCERLYPSREHHHLVPASVTDPAWLQAIPPDRPALLLAEGLTMYLTEQDGVAVLERVVEHFCSGELQFDVLNWFGILGQKLNPVVRRSGATMSWAINGPADILRAVPGVRLLAAISAFDAETFRQMTNQQSAVYRLLARAVALIPTVRATSQYLRFGF